jgi:hypothetical protein
MLGFSILSRIVKHSCPSIKRVSDCGCWRKSTKSIASCGLDCWFFFRPLLQSSWGIDKVICKVALSLDPSLTSCSIPILRVSVKWAKVCTLSWNWVAVQKIWRIFILRSLDSTWYVRRNEGTDKANPELGLKLPCGPNFSINLVRSHGCFLLISSPVYGFHRDFSLRLLISFPCLLFPSRLLISSPRYFSCIMFSSWLLISSPHYFAYILFSYWLLFSSPVSEKTGTQ